MNATTSKSTIRKEVSPKGKYLLGLDQYGDEMWLTAASWDCEWYWGFGYIHQKDSHTHVDSRLMGKQEVYNCDKNCWQLSSDYVHNIFHSPEFSATSFTEAEGWVLSELFSTFYILEETAGMYNRGGSHVADNPLMHVLKNKEQEDHINKILLPAIFEEIYKILRP